MLGEKQVTAEMSSLDDFIAGKTVDPAKASSIPQLQKLVASITDPKSARLSRALIAFDNAAEAPAVDSSFLVINGAKDIQIDELDARRLYKALRDAKGDVTLEILANTDHVLKTETRTVAVLRANLVAVKTTTTPTIASSIRRSCG